MERGSSDFFLDLLRRILPIALHVCKWALSAMIFAQEEAASFTDTIKSAVRPATKGGIHEALSQIDTEQQASGGRRGGKDKTLSKGPKAKRTKTIIDTYEGGSES